MTPGLTKLLMEGRFVKYYKPHQHNNGFPFGRGNNKFYVTASASINEHATWCPDESALDEYLSSLKDTVMVVRVYEYVN